MAAPHNHGDGPYHGETVRISAQGLVTITQKFVADTLADVFRIRRQYRTYEGLPRTDCEASQRPAGCYDVTLTFEGQSPDTEGQNETGEGEEWEVISEFSEEPIESHFIIDKIVDYYGGWTDGDGRIKFPEFMEIPSRSGGTSKGREIKNPMFGREFYFQTGSVVRLTTIEKRVPSDIARFGDRILKRLPITDLKHIDWGDRDWLEMQPQVRKRGNVFELTREFKMSPPGKWPRFVVGFIDQR